MDFAAYRELVLSIYKAADEPAHWVTVLDQISDLVSARGGMIIEMQRRGDQVILETPVMTSNYQPDFVQEYFDRHREAETRDHKIFDRKLLELDGIDILDEAILYQSREDYLTQPHVVELAERGIAHRTGALLDKDNPYRARFSLSMGKRRGPFSDEDVALLKDILPHVAKALELSRPASLTGPVRSMLAALMESFDVGACLVDAQGRIIEFNTEFRRQKEEYKAFPEDLRGQLTLAAPQNQARLRNLLEDSLNHARFGARPRKEAILVPVPQADTTLCVEVLPLPRSQELGTQVFNGALVISRDTATPVAFDIALAKMVFELTTKEAEILALVAEGLTNKQIAALRGRSVETINVQLRAVFQKTRTENRTQLVRLLCNFANPPTSDRGDSDS